MLMLACFDVYHVLIQSARTYSEVAADSIPNIIDIISLTRYVSFHYIAIRDVDDGLHI